MSSSGILFLGICRKDRYCAARDRAKLTVPGTMLTMSLGRADGARGRHRRVAPSSAGPADGVGPIGRAMRQALRHAGPERGAP